MVTSRDIQEIISKLSSDKAKTREEGIKLLNSWLEGERSVGFCKFLGQNTAKLKPDQVHHAETWPFLITLLTQCISLEISASKRRPPKLIFAKTLRMFIQRAEDAKFSGKMLLLSVVKPLLTHIWDVLRDVPGFQSEYGIILRQLLVVKDYRFHMRKRVYCSLVILYMGKVEASLSEKNNIQFNPREEVFRCILTLHCLLENPPGDFPDNLRENVVKGFVGIFSYVRDEGKISRKLMECINTYMLKDGPNLGFWSLKIHSAMQEFVFRYWLTTHDRGLKDALILYAHLQLKLTRTSADGSHLLEQLLDVVVKELDQSNMPCAIMPRSDGTREDKSGTLTSSQGSLLELAATVFYRACIGTSKACSEKRSRRENAAALVREGLKNGRWLWHGAFCYLTRRYHFRIIKDLFIYWFEGICESFERVLNDANTKHAYDGLLWVLRSLQELSIVPLLSVSSVKISKCSSTTSNELCGGWHAIWSSLMHGLPIFSNVTSVADAALVVLGNIIANDLVSRPIVPQDVWDLRLFKHKPSVSGLYFISCYFSRKGSEGNIRDVLHLRRDLLRVVVRLLSWKEPSVLNERVIVLLPGSIYSLCDGCNPFTNYYSGLSGSHSYADVSEAIEDCFKVEGHDRAAQEELFECYVDALAEIKLGFCVEVSQSQSQPSLRLPRQIRDPLVHEMENCLLALLDIEINKIPLSDLFFLCALLSNFIYGLILTRLNERKSSFFTKSCQLLLELLEYAVSFVHKTNDDLLRPGCSGTCPSFDDTISILSSVKIFLHCPLFIFWREQNFVDEISIETIYLVEKLLRALAKLFEECLACARDLQFQTDTPDFYSSSRTSVNSSALDVNKSRIVDLELDVNVNIENSDILAVSGKLVTGISFSSVKWKLDMVSVMSSFFFVLPVVTWGILFGLMEKEDDPMVVENILYSLCEHSTCVSTAMFSDLVNFMHNMAEARFNLRLCCVNMLAAICSLMRTLLFSMSGGKDKNIDLSLLQSASKESLESLGDLVNKIAEHDLIDWFGRIKLIDCICNFFRLDPHMGQLMIERLLMMHHDTDYRVRLFLARRIGVLFQIWDGHNDLFQDICSNFGVKLVLFSKDKLVSAKEILADASQPPPVMETIIVALAHVALYSERIELEAIFMICVIAAIDPCQRDLVYAILNNLSRQLQYETRPKYLEELMGSIIFCWVACDVSLVALFEIRDLFVSGTEPRSFLQCCCHWLLPALLLHGDTSNLKWAAAVASQPLAVLVKGHFVPIFAICMTLHCSKKSGWEEGRMVLQNSILHIAEICVDERDNLIKKHMVSIVSFMLSLSSRSSDPRAPFFSQDTIVLAIRTIVDGFLEMEDCSTNVGVVDKIKIFRPDRVFMFILEMHYKVSAAVHHRHRCNWLSGIEVLVKIIGHRALVSSTSCYLFNLIGQYISCQALQEQCCLILSMLLKSFKTNPTKETTCVLGQQLQFLVPKLIECCIPSETGAENSGTQSSRVVGLLHGLTVDADSSLHDFIRELEPFPEINCFNEIRRFHEELCISYHPRDRFLNFVKRSCYFPPKLLMWSLRALHKKLLLGDIIQHGKNMENSGGQSKEWHGEPEIVSAVWTLVPLCGLHDANSFTELVSDFIARVGISDPHGVVFRLPGDSHQMLFLRPTIRDSAIEFFFDSEMGVSDELLTELIRLLMKYLLDDSVKIIDKTSQALRGILSTERGQKALFSFDTYERSLIAIHSKGINMELVEKFLLDLERKSEAEAISLEMSSVWKTHGKTFQSWISPLVYSLISYSNDLTLRLCQDIVLVKAEVAELLLPSVLINLARRKDLNVDICKLISSQVQENIFIESNDLNRSIQVVLDALNELRLCHVMENASSSVILPKQDSLKCVRPSSCTKSHKKQEEKAKDSNTRSKAVVMSTTSWEKVYWLSIDYLLAAKSAIQCGSYFTSVMYVEHWCEEHFKSLTLGSPDFSHLEMLPAHIEILISAVTQINEPDSLYGIIQSHKLASQLITYEHEGNWSKALEYYDLQVRSAPGMQMDGCSKNLTAQCFQPGIQLSMYESQDEMTQQKPYKGLIRALQRIGCSHVLDLYCQGLTSQKSHFQNDPEFRELQYEAAWRAGNWDFSLLYMEANSRTAGQCIRNDHFNENLHSCLRALQEGDFNEFHMKLVDSKQELVFSVYQASRESTEYIYSSIVKLQILDHLGMAWDLRWKPSPCGRAKSLLDKQKVPSQPVIPTMDQVAWLNTNWSCILQQAQLHMNLFEPFIAFRRVLLQILSCNEWTIQNLLQSASILRKSSRFTLAAAALQELKFFTAGMERQCSTSYLCFLGRLEEAKLLRAQGQNEMAISLAKYISHNYQLNGEASNVHRLIGKWLAETRSSNSKTILEQYLKRAVELSEANNSTDEKCFSRLCQTQFHLAHYTDALFRNYEERLNSSEWQAAIRLRKHKAKELEALSKRLKSSIKGEKTDYSAKIQELKQQLTMDNEEAEKLHDDRDNFLSLALEGYKRCLVIGDKYDVQVVFRLVSLWFSLSSRQNVVYAMLSTVKEVQSYKFIPLVYQIASRMGSSKDGHGPHSFQFALVSLVKKMAMDHPYHTIFQLLALANGDRVKDKQRSRDSFVVDMDKKLAAENLLSELSSHHGAIIRQMKQMVEIYIKLAELETKREDTNKRIPLPREIRSLRQLELVPVVTASFPVDRSCQYHEGSFPHFKGLADSVMIMNGINAPKVVECLGSDGNKYRQLAKSGNDDLRQDAVMEQFFGLVNTFLLNHRDSWKRRLGVRTYKVVPFTPSAGVLEWVDGTIPLGEYLIGSTRSGGAHGRYGFGDWSFLQCRVHMTNEKDKRKAFQKVCENFRPVMHYFFLERFIKPADWFEKRLAYTRSVAASSMVGYIVGLGDRHSMNILIDQATAEVVHIDLGVAFEQGLMLKTPERVPFRLTRDIMDGMGVTGVEGIFRRCCEETVSVMRTNKEALLTIIEVFIHDPLYKWALSPLKALQRQKETDDDLVSSLEGSQDEYEGNKDAARALMRVKQKLDGYEEGEMRSVHGQVQQLIQDAIDPERLCQMFPGWGAWL